MRSPIMRAVVLAVVLVCVFAYISELFDTWDHTFESGNDTEFSVAILALCVGAAFIFVRLLRPLFLNWVLDSYHCVLGQAPTPIRGTILALPSTSPPPLRV